MLRAKESRVVGSFASGANLAPGASRRGRGLMQALRDDSGRLVRTSGVNSARLGARPRIYAPSVGIAIDSPRRAIPRLVLAALVALAPTTALAAAPAPASPRERSQVLLVEGDAAAERGELDEAISKYRSAYYGLSTSDQASYVGSLPVRKAMQAYEQAVARERDPAARRMLLERQRVLLDEFLDGVAARPGAVDEIGEDVMAELEVVRRGIAVMLAAKAHDDVVDSPDAGDASGRAHDRTEATGPASPPSRPEPTNRRSTAIDQPVALGRDWLGLGLAIGGGTLVATGAGLCVGSWTIRKGARELVDDGGPGWAEGTDARAGYLADEDARARKLLISGSVVAGVGLATAVAGVVHVVVHRRRHGDRAAAMGVAPLLTSTATGVVLLRRF